MKFLRQPIFRAILGGLFCAAMMIQFGPPRHAGEVLTISQSVFRFAITFSMYKVFDGAELSLIHWYEKNHSPTHLQNHIK